MTRTMVFSLAISLVASSANAQWGGPLAGIIPYAVNTPAAGVETSNGNIGSKTDIGKSCTGANCQGEREPPQIRGDAGCARCTKQSGVRD
jgi:hypothetical protein